MGPARLAVGLLVVAAAAWAGISLTADAGVDGEPIDDAALVQPVDDGSAIWPYTSRSRSAAGRTLALNLVVVGDPDTVRLLLTNRTAIDWAPAADDTRARIDSQGVVWRTARGAARYTYTRSPDGEGRWVLADYQLATGQYLGSRVHIRAYASPDRDWTALQAHEEYWDWFRLRHIVTGVGVAGRFLEADLRDEPAVAGIERLDHGFEGGGGDGQLTVVELALGLAVLIGIRARHLPRRIDRLEEAGLPLVVALAGIVIGVRVTGIALETAAPGIDPRVFAAGLYPVLIIGPLAALRALAGRHQPAAAFGLTVAGLGLGIIVDTLALGLVTLPPHLVTHRIVLVAALGVVAVGIADGEERGRATVAAGTAAWFGAIAAPLVGIV